MAIGRGLRANCSLQNLDISWNGLADEGAAAFGESLKENNTLTDLDLTNNRISTEGALAFAKGLQINNTLKILRFVNYHCWYRFLDFGQFWDSECIIAGIQSIIGDN